MEEPYDAVDIVHLRGGFDQVFDRYFQLMEIPKPRVQHKCGYTTGIIIILISMKKL